MNQSLQLSRRLLELMKAGAWEEAQELEAERRRMIRQEFAAGQDQGLSEKVAILREIDALNREIAALGCQGKSRLSSQLRQLRQGRRVDKAYRQVR